MIKLTTALFGLLLLSRQVFAEMQCPDWDTICPEDQRLTGLVVQRGDSKEWPTLHIRVPPKSVPVWVKATLLLKHKDRNQRVEVNMGFMPTKDGWSEVNVYLWDKCFDEAELTIYLDLRNRDALMAPRLKNCKDFADNFAGFTFTIPPPH